MTTQKIKTWDVLQEHPIAKDLDSDTQVALLCEYTDLRDELQGMTLAEFIDGYFAAGEPEEGVAEAEDAATEPGDNGAEEPYDLEADAIPRPANMVGMRIVYRFPGRNVLSDEQGVTRDADGVVSFVDVDGEAWSNIRRDHVHMIDPENYSEIHITPREARDFNIWLAGTPAKGQPEGALLRSLFVEFPDFPDKIAFAIMNGKKPYVDRFVALVNNGFEDDQKPTTRLFGEHCFRIRGRDYVVKVVTP